MRHKSFPAFIPALFRAFAIALLLAFCLPACQADGPGVLSRLLGDPEAVDQGIDPAGVNPNAPAAPTGLWAVAISASRVDLGWNDNAATETGYKVYRRKGAGAWVLAGSLAPGTTSFSCTGLKGGKNYTFKVIAYNSYGKGGSNLASASTYPLWPISSPTNLYAWAVGITSINLTWPDGSNNELGFKIERKTGEYGSWSQVGTVGENVTIWTSTGLAPETSYSFRVRAYNASGNSAFSPEASAITSDDIVPPSAVNVTANILTSIRIDLAWSAATDNYQVGGYEVYRDETRLGSTGTTTRAWSDGSVPSPATDYCYVVNAIDTVGNATPSSPLCVFTNGLSKSFPVASAGQQAMGLSAASNGQSFLAGFIGDTISDSAQHALLVSARARALAPRLDIDGGGGLPSVAWNGYHYLLMWPDDGSTTAELTGQLVGASGDTVGSPFTIAAGAEGRALVAGGGKWLAVYTTEEPAGSGRGRLWGRFISDGGTVEAPIALTGDTVATGLSLQAASFDGYGFLVTFRPVKAAEGWAENKVAGKFISLAGSPGTQVTIDSDESESLYTASAYVSGQHLVVWTDLAGAGNADVYARTVTPLGTMGTEVAVTTAAGGQIHPGVATDGTSFLVSWVDTVNDLDGDGACDVGESTCWDLKAQKLTMAGVLSGEVFTVSADAGSQLGIPVFGSGRYFFLVSNFSGVVGDSPSVVTGRFLTP